MKKSLLYAGICALIFAAVPFAAKAEAPKLLKSGKRAEAIALINAAALLGI